MTPQRVRLRPACPARRIALAVVAAMVASTIGARGLGQEWEMTEQQFDSWICQTGGNPAENAQGSLTQRLALLEDAVQLTPGQREKLSLAGTVDISRFLDKVETVRRRIVGKKYDQNQINEAWQEVQPLQAELEKGLVQDGSLFEKVKHSVLGPAQRAQLQRVEYAIAKRRYEAKLRQYVAALDRALAMTNRQRQGLLALFVSQTKPPNRFGEYDRYYVLWQMSQISDQRLGTLLDQPQVKVFRQIANNGQRYESWLENQGVRPLDEPTTPPDAEGNDG